MPDDVVKQYANDRHTAFIALSHDPKVDDMALMEALKTESFYIGALGSRNNNAARRKRLATLDLTQQQIDRLHGPVGLAINSKTPEEIAVSILAEVIQEKNSLLYAVNGSNK
jgi:xanthine dehydrogenase accessory factor